MRGTKALLALALVAAVTPNVLSADEQALAQCAAQFAPAPLTFNEPTYVDTNRAGGEPVIIAAEDGSLNLSAHAGTTHAFKDPAVVGGAGDFAVGYYNQTLNWRSVDDGKSWSYVGLVGTHQGPHSLSSTGFSDPGYAMDDFGNLYNVEIDLANVAVFASTDDGQSWNIANPEVSAGDRPWLTGGNEDGEAFLYIRLPGQLWRTTNTGITWTPVKVSGLPIYGQIYRDPLNPDGLIGPRGGSASNGFAISGDDGVTWTTPPTFPFSSAGDQIFAPIDIDKADGTVYMANGNGYRGASDNFADGYLEFNYFDRDLGDWGLEEAQRLPIPEGDVLWTWMVAGDDGRVAMAWLQTLVDPDTGEFDNDSFYIYVAQTTNAKGTDFDCDGDGVLEHIPAQWEVANASGRVIHVGDVCLSGTTCNANLNFAAGDRRLGDFFQINYDRNGRLIIGASDTMLPSLTAGPKPVSNPIFIGQSGGDMMLTTPLPTRETRCLTNLLPICGE